MSSKNLTLYVPADVADKMDELPEVNWSRIARDAIQTYIKDRLETSIPSEVISRLRKEKGREFASGKKYAAEVIIPEVTYKKMSSFFERASESANSAVRNEAAVTGAPLEVLSPEPYRKQELLSSIKWFFGHLPEDSTEQFVKGALSAIEETWNKLEE